MVEAGLAVVVILIAAAIGWIANQFTPKRGMSIGVALASIGLLAGTAGIVIFLQQRETSPSTFVGGCDTFRVYAQNQYEPYGTAARESTSAASRKVASFAPNEIIAVDGWVVSQRAYPTNPEPWNSGVWFHLADDSGWVSFAAVRRHPTSHTEENDGGVSAVPTTTDCAGSAR